VRIVSEKFNSLSRIERQRLVYAALAEEIAAGVHALALTTLTPEESRR
jgi:BolA protein